MLLLLTEKHTPQEIISYFSKFGKVRMIIRAGKFYLEYDNPNHQLLVLKNRNIQINGKSIQIQQEGQPIIQQQPLQINPENVEIKNQKAAQLIKILLQCKEQTILELEKLFKKTVKQIECKIQGIDKQYPDQVINKSQIMALQDLLRLKTKDFTYKCTSHLKQLKNSVRQFSKVKPKIYDIEPEFKLATNFTTKRINYENPSIDQGLQFTNPENQSIKRIQALNGNSFIVTQRNENGPEGQLKFYDCKEIAPSSNIQYQKAAPYGACILNDIILLGHINGEISIHSLNNQRQFEPIKMHNEIIFDIKNFRFKENFIITGSYDRRIKIYEVKDQPVTDTYFEVQLQQKHNSEHEVFQAFQQWDQQFISLGCEDKLIFYSLSKKKKTSVLCNSKICRIKKLNQNLITTGLEDGRVLIIDTRNNNIVANCSTNTILIRGLEVIPDYSIFYGGKQTVGVVDSRNMNHIIWTNMNKHRDLVQDITRLQSSVISGDRAGIICEWTL